MKNCALVNPETGEIVNFLHPSNPDNFIEGSSYGDGLIVRWDNEEVFTHFAGYYVNKYYYDGETFVEKPARPTPYYVFDWDQKKWSFDSEGFLESARMARNNLLSMSDWSQLGDSPLDEDDKELWSIYRQELRDLEEYINGVDDVAEIEWPQTP